MQHVAQYRHIQRSPLSLVLIAVAIGTSVIAWTASDEPMGWIVAAIVSLLLVLAAGSFHQLTVSTEDSALLLQFGLIPLFRKQIPYASMRSVEPSKSRVVDGWGIHYVPLRGWTYNLWGFGCVLIQRHEGSPIRVGTDDVEGLNAALQARLEEGCDCLVLTNEECGVRIACEPAPKADEAHHAALSTCHCRATGTASNDGPRRRYAQPPD